MIRVPDGDTFAAYTDGACSGNPGPGGFAYLIQISTPEPWWDGRRTGWGSEPRTTNNRMEMRAVIACLERLGPMDRGAIHSDSQYVVKGINEWRSGWEKKGKLREGADTPNLDLWLKLFAIRDAHPDVRFVWVKGHADSEANNEVDRLAVEAAAKQLPEGTAQANRAEPAPPTNPIFLHVCAAADKELAEQVKRVARMKLLCPAAQARVESAVAVFGMDNVVPFLFGYAPSLGKSPLEMLESGDLDAIQAVEDHIGRIQHGVYA